MKTKILLIPISALLLSSCATIFTGSKKAVVIDANVKEAQSLTVDGYRYKNVEFPYRVKVKGGFDETVIKTETKGYEPYTLIIDKTFNAVSALNLLDVLGWGIDAATGAMMKPEFKFYEIEFESEK